MQTPQTLTLLSRALCGLCQMWLSTMHFPSLHSRPGPRAQRLWREALPATLGIPGVCREGLGTVANETANQTRCLGVSLLLLLVTRSS